MHSRFVLGLTNDVNCRAQQTYAYQMDDLRRYLMGYKVTNEEQIIQGSEVIDSLFT